MIKEDVKFINSTVFEGMTSIRAIIRAWDEGIAKRQIKEILYDAAKITKISKEIGYLKAVSEKYGFSVRESNSEEIDKITLGSSHGGIIAITEERVIPCLTADSPIKPDGFYCMIQGIEDPYNFGYALRTIYAAGADGVILSERNWMSAAGVVCRASAGASEMMPMFTSNSVEAISEMKKLDYKVACAGIRDSVSAFNTDLKKPIFLIVGGEKRGISAQILSMADSIVRLDYGREFNGSLSAASAASILAYEVLRQNL